MNASREAPPDLAQQLFVLLDAVPQGCSEYQLIQQLRDRQDPNIPHLSLLDSLVLFRTHFLVFNALYRLRDRLWSQRSHHLCISPLLVQLQPFAEAADPLAEADPLRDYYLDMRNLRDTDQAEVERLLESFWARMYGHRSDPHGAPDADQRLAALELFELEDSQASHDFGLVKHRYRQLVSAHHPDRGGSTPRLQSINLAMEILERYYR